MTKISHIVTALFGTKSITSVLNILSVVLLVRYFPETEYGFLMYILAYFSFFIMFLNGFDETILRYIPIKKSPEFAVHLLHVKNMSCIVALLIGFALFFLIDIIPNHSHLFLFGVFVAFMQFFNQLLISQQKLLQSLQQYKRFLFLDLFIAISGIALVLSIIISQGSLLGFVIGKNIQLLFCLVYGILLLQKVQKTLAKQFFMLQLNKKTIRVMRKYYKPYGFSLSLVSVATFIKNSLPKLLIGSFGSLTAVTYYAVFRDLFAFVHKGFAMFIETVAPRIYASYNKKTFVIQFRKYFLQGYLLRLGITVIALVCMPAVLFLFDFVVEKNIITLYYLFASHFLISYFLTTGTLLAKIAQKTRIILQAAVFRATVGLILTVFLIVQYDAIGAVVALLITTTCIGVFYIYQTKNMSKNALSQGLIIVCSLLLIFIALFI